MNYRKHIFYAVVCFVISLCFMGAALLYVNDGALFMSILYGIVSCINGAVSGMNLAEAIEQKDYS